MIPETPTLNPTETSSTVLIDAYLKEKALAQYAKDKYLFEKKEKEIYKVSSEFYKLEAERLAGELVAVKSEDSEGKISVVWLPVIGAGMFLLGVMLAK